MVDDDLAPPPAPTFYAEEKKKRGTFFNFIKKKKSQAEKKDVSEELPELPDISESPTKSELKRHDKPIKKEDELPTLDLDDIPLPPSPKKYEELLKAKPEEEPKKEKVTVKPKPVPKPMKIKAKPEAKPKDKKPVVKKIKTAPKPVKQITPKVVPKPVKEIKPKAAPKPVKKQSVQAKPIKKAEAKPEIKPAKKIKLPKPKDELDEEIERYFAQMEKEQQKLKKELDKILPGIKPLQLQTGEQVHSLRQLKEAIERLDKETFQHHIEHNDFYKWVKDILKEEELAESLRNKIVKKDVLLALKLHEDDIKKTIQSKEMNILQDKRFRQGLIKELQAKIEELHDLAVNLTKKDAYLKNKEKTINEKVKQATQDKLAEIERTRKSLEAQKKTLDVKAADVENAKKEASKKEADLSAQRKQFEKDKSEAQKLFDSIPKIKQDKKDLELKQKDFKKSSDKESQRLKTWEASLKREKARLDKEREDITSKLKKRQEIEAYFKSIEGKLKQERTDVEEKGFGTYLKAKLKEVGQIDVEEEAKQESPAVKGGTYFEIYKKIDTCRNLIDASKLEDAKKLYKEIKDEFYKARLSDKEKPILYNAIRELYDDIHLAVLEQS